MRQAHYLRTAPGGQQTPALCCASVGQADGGGLLWALQLPRSEQDEHWSEEMSIGESAAAFWHRLRWLLKKRRSAWLLFLGTCHQLTELGFWDLLEEDAWQLQDWDSKAPADGPCRKGGRWSGFAILQDPPTVILTRPRGNYGVCKMLDARNYGVSGWPALGASAAAGPLTAAQHADRAARLARFMAGWIDTVQTHKLGSVQTTAAAQAMHAFRHRFLKAPVLVHANRAALQLERDACYAGRNECWRIGLAPGTVYHLDVNSCYPAAACGEMMPARLAGYTDVCDPPPLKLMDAGYLVVSDVTIDTDSNDYPVRFSGKLHGNRWLVGSQGEHTLRPQEGELLYPVGTFRTALCGPELRHALDRGRVKRIWRTAWYEPSELFTSWAREIHALQLAAEDRQEAGEAECLKRVRNSLIGKFAQWEWRWRPCPAVAAPAPFCIWYAPPPEHPEAQPHTDAQAWSLSHQSRSGHCGMVRYRAIGWYTQVEEGLGEHPESCPAIAAWVYSLARVRLLEAIATAGPDNVHYMDADSLWTNLDGYRRMQAAGLCDQRAMGKWKLAGAYEWARFHGLKVYTLPGAEKHAGAPPDAAGNHVDGWKFWKPEKLMPALSAWRAPATQLVRHQLVSAPRYRIGTVTTGGRVVPLVLQGE